MATVTITIPDAQLDRVVEALCVTRGIGPPTPANAKAALVGWVKETTLNYDRQKAHTAAVASVAAPTDPGVT